jgi:integrase
MARRDGVFKRNGFWWVDYVDVDGRRHRQKAAPSYDVARLMLREKLNAIAKGEILGVRDEQLRVVDFIDTVWWPRQHSRLNPDWAIRVRGMLDGTIVPTFGGYKLATLRKETIDTWAAERRTVVSGSTFNKEIWTLKSLLKSAAAWGYLRTSPAQHLARATESHGRVRYLSDEERRVLVDGITITVTASDGRTWPAHVGPNATLKLYIVVALNTGGRRAELRRLTWGDIDLRQRLITFKATKNGRDRTIPMTKTLHALLLTLPRSLDASRPVLPPIAPLVLTRSFARLVHRLGLKDLRFHDLRHDVASTMAMDGVPLWTIGQALGHRDLRMTARYAHVSPDHLREAMKSLERREPA